MRAIAAHPDSNEPTFVEANEPRAPGEGEVLCRSLELGVCGTDREILESRQPLVPPGENHLILGHECLGRVEEVGAGVSGFRVGDFVVPVVRRPLNVSTNRADMLPFGRYTERGIVCEHGFSAPLWLDRPEYLFRVDESLAPLAVLTEPLSVAEKGANEALIVQRARLGDNAWTDPPPRVLVTGMGPIGFAAVISCVCRGWPVTMYGRDDENSFRANLARSFGATYLAATNADFIPRDVEQDGYDLILECTGSGEVATKSAESLASCGVFVWLGSSRIPKPRPHNLSLLMRNAILRNHLFLGTVNAAPRDFAYALQHLAQMQTTHPTAIHQLITDRLPPQESLWHYQHRKPQGIKTVLVYDAET